MTVPLLDSLTSTPARQLRNRWSRVSIPAVVVALAVGAYLYWGPVGFGNGPLSVTWRGGEGTADPGPGPVGTVLPISVGGTAPAVVDGIDFIGSTRYATPRVLASGMLTTSSDCGVAAVPAQPGVTGRGFTIAGCGSYSGPLVGHVFQPAHGSSGLTAAAELTAPQRGTCWAVTRVVVHYHVGGKHFSGVYPFALAACLGVDSAGVHAALNAADVAP